MGLLSKIARGTARAGARATGRALSRHVLPDTLLPSWKTQRALETGYQALKRATKRKKKKSSDEDEYRPRTRSAKRPAAPKPKQKFDKNAWSRGDKLKSASSFDERPPSRSASSSISSVKKRASRLSSQVRDVVRNPRLVAQMQLDLLEHDYQQKKRHFLSNLREARAKFPF